MGTTYRLANIFLRNVISKTGNYTATLFDDDIIYSGASATLGLPSAVGNKGKEYSARHNGTSGTQIYTVDPNGAETIGGRPTLRLCTNGDFAKWKSDGANWNLTVLRLAVSASYRNIAGTSYTAAAAADVPFATKVFDNRGIFSTPTATIEFAGEYLVEAQVGQIGSIHSTIQFQNLTLLQNGSVLARDRKYGNNDLGTAQGIFNKVSQKLQCAVNDTIKVQMNSSINITYSSTVGDCYFNLTRTGD